MPARGSQFNQVRAKRLSIEGRLAGGSFRDCLLHRNFQTAVTAVNVMSQPRNSGSTTMASSVIRRSNRHHGHRAIVAAVLLAKKIDDSIQPPIENRSTLGSTPKHRSA
jgi:hypothetical protein